MKEILVLGHDIDAANVESYTWSDVPNGINPADYDLVVVDFVIAQQELLAHTLEAIVVPEALGFLNLLKSNKLLVYIGLIDGFAENARRPQGGRKGYSAASILPACPSVVRQESKSFSLVDDRYMSYFAHIDKMSFYFDLPNPMLLWDHALRVHLSGDLGEFSIGSSVIAQTKANHPVALSYSIDLYEAKPRNISFLDERMSRYKVPRQLGTLGKIVWLPPVTDGESLQSVKDLLQDVFGVEMNDRLPSWTNDWVTHSETELLQNATVIQESIDGLTVEKEGVLQQAELEFEWKKLLFATGPELEQIVIEALEFIGVRVALPTVKGREDGTVELPDCGEFVVEIKGRSGVIKLSDVRQLTEWSRFSKLSGLIIANAHCGVSPADRGDALAPNAATLADEHDFKLLSTVTLFQMVSDMQSGKDVMARLCQLMSKDCVVVDWDD